MTPRFLRNYLRLAVQAGIGQLPALPVQGNIVDGPGFAAFMASLIGGVSPINAQINASAITNVTTGALTLTPANCANGLINAIVVASGGSANTDTTDTATNIIANYWPNAAVGSVALLNLVNLNSGTTTLAGGTGVTITGTATIPTLANAYYSAKITNLANPALPGAVATNSTTTTAAVAVNNTQAAPTSVIPVAASTGMVANASYLKWINADGTSSYALVTAINTLNITVAGSISKPILSGAAVTVFNNAITFTRLYSCVTAILAA